MLIMTWDTFVAIAIVIVAAAYLVYRYIFSKRSGCGCSSDSKSSGNGGCGGCGGCGK